MVEAHRNDFPAVLPANNTDKRMGRLEFWNVFIRGILHSVLTKPTTVAAVSYDDMMKRTRLPTANMRHYCIEVTSCQSAENRLVTSLGSVEPTSEI